MRVLLWKKIYIILVGLLLVFPVASATNNWIRDEQGRVIILHGVNISNVAKHTDDHTSWQTFDDYERLSREWGFNVIRYLIFWSAIEPEPGVFNETYLDKVEERLKWAESLGIYVILDMHQDVYGEKFGGDGAPIWATYDDGIPFIYIIPLWLNYAQPAVRRAITNFWTSTELREHFFYTWVHVVQRFKNNTAILGYNLFNEPSFGNIPPGLFEKYVLTDFYLELISELKKIDPNRLYFYEPQIATSSDWNAKSHLGKIPEENLVYSPHYYIPWVLKAYIYFGFPFLLEKVLANRKAEAEMAGVPWILAEFGLSDNTIGLDQYLINILTLLNQYMTGWICWSYDYESDTPLGIIDDYGNENAQLNYLIYPYPQKIAGDPVTFFYSFENKSCYIEFVENASVRGPTEIYVGQSRIHPKGFSLICSDPDETWHWEYEPSLDIVKVWTNPNVENHRISITSYEEKDIKPENPQSNPFTFIFNLFSLN